MSADEAQGRTKRSDRYSRRTGVLIAIVTAAMASIVGMGGFVLLSETPAPLTPDDVRLAQADTEPMPNEQGEPEDVGSLVTTHEVFLDRDPFSRVIPTTAAPQPPGELGSPADAGAPLPATAPSLLNTPVDSLPDVVGAACTGTHELVCDRQVVTLGGLETVDDEPLAEIHVDTSSYQVRSGETFAADFRLAGIAEPCVTVLYGDEGYPLCMEQSGTK